MSKNTPERATHQPVVRAIDVGFGVVKLTKQVGDKIVCDNFPAMAIPSDPSEMRQLGRRSRDTVDVPVDGAMYEVGKEILLAQTGNDFGREITDEFYRSAIYEALMKGAFRYMGDEVIDVLVIGLPVNQYQNSERSNELIQKYGNAELDLGTDSAGNSLSIKIRDVVVRPQPLGGYLEMFNQIDVVNEAIKATGGALKPVKDVDELVELTTLIVDPGEHTLDWLMVQRGDINRKASGAASDSGRHRVVREVYNALTAKLGRPLGSYMLPKINEALRTNRPIKFEGEEFDLAEFGPVVRASVQDPINRLIEGTRGMMGSVDLIVIVGGHPELYRNEMQSRYPKIPVVILRESIEANVRGFHSIGEEIAARQEPLAA